MGKTQRKKKKKKPPQDFMKVKLKPGKKLKKANATDTRVDTKKVVLVEQLATSTGVLSHRGLSLEDLCRQLGHYNMNVRRDALIGVQQLLSANRPLVLSSLRLLVPTVARLICDDKSDDAFRGHLSSLLFLLCDSPSEALSPHFALFVAHTLRALTHTNAAVRAFALSVLVLLMRAHPCLARHSADLFDVLMSALSGQRIPNKLELCREAMLSFLKMFETLEEAKPRGAHHVAYICTATGRCSSVNLTPRAPLVDIALLAPGLQQVKSPLETKEGVLRVASTLSILAEKLFHLEKQLSPRTLAVAVEFERVVSRFRATDPSREFEETLQMMITPLLRIFANEGIPRQFRKVVASLQRKVWK